MSSGCKVRAGDVWLPFFFFCGSVMGDCSGHNLSLDPDAIPVGLTLTLALDKHVNCQAVFFLAFAVIQSENGNFV